MLQVLITFWRHVRNGLYTFCRQREVVGTRYLVGQNFHYSERIFWAILLLLSIFGTVYSVIAFTAYYEGNMFQMIFEDQPQFEVLDFPSIAVCQTRSTIEAEKMEKVLDRLRQRHPKILFDNNFKALLNAITFPDYHANYNRTFTEFLHANIANGQLKFYDELNYKKLTEELRGNCSELFHECTWRDKKFNCCEYFVPITGFSQSCFMLNSFLINGSKHLEMKIEKYIPNTSIELVLNGVVKVFMLNENDIPEKLSPLARSSIIVPGRHCTLGIRILVNYNDPELYNFSPQLIKCWPPNYHIKEPYTTYKFASFTTCLTDCLRLLQWKTCGCIKQTLNEGTDTSRAPYCNLSGYACLEQHGLYEISALRNLPESTCNHCLMSCKKQTINIVDTSFTDYVENERKKRAKVTIKLSGFPIKRTRRQVIRNYMDITVLLGGIISLFIGFSLVHIIEVFYCIIYAFTQPTFLN